MRDSSPESVSEIVERLEAKATHVHRTVCDDALMRQAAEALKRLEGELARCGRDNCMGQKVEGVARWVREERLTAAEADNSRLRASLERAKEVLGRCQFSLPEVYKNLHAAIASALQEEPQGKGNTDV